VIASCVHRLVERGLLDYDAPVSEYWPEFARGRKAGVTVRHVLSHRAGCPALEPGFDWLRVEHWRYATAETAALTAISEPGAAVAYHTLTFGWILGELVRRTDGRMPRDFMREEIFEPLGVAGEISLGLTGEALERRVPVHAISEASRRDPTGAERGTSRIVESYNQPQAARAQIPAANCFGTARALARFFACLEANRRGEPLDGVTLLRPETIERATRVHAETERDGTQDVPKRYGLGFYLSGLRHDPFDVHDGPSQPPLVYGHQGQQSSIAYADPRYGLAVAYVTNGLHEPGVVRRRCVEMSAAIRAACE
jgi:CubicO group peptidase (beta-lactamase class C family)